MIEWIASASILIAVIIVLRFILKGKISLRLQYALWGLVLLRLLVPVNFGATGLSVGNLTQKAAETETAQVLSTLTQFELPRMTYNAAYSEVANEYAEKGVDIAEMPVEEYERVDYEILSRMGGQWNIRDVLKVVWILGIAAVGFVLLISNLRLALKLKKGHRLIEVVGCQLPVYLSDEVDTPCLFGLFHPAIYVTPGVAESETALRHSIEHELTHYRHGDHIWSLLRGACLAIHWYNPLVWWAAILSRNDAELACDEATIKRIGENERAEYGRTLIGLTCQKRPALLLTATTMTVSKSSIKERIMLIAKKPKTAIYTLVAVLLIAAVAVGCTFTGAEKTPPDNDTPPQTPSQTTPPATQAPSAPPASGEVDIGVAAGLDSVPAAVLDYARDYTRTQLEYYTDELGCTITEAKITGMTPLDIWPTADTTVGMWLLEYRFLPAEPDEAALVGGMRMEAGYITEWGSTGQPYLILNRTGDDTYERIGETHTLTMQEEYSTPEMLEQYSDMYTAAAMELYKKHEKSSDVVTLFVYGGWNDEKNAKNEDTEYTLLGEDSTTIINLFYNHENEIIDSPLESVATLQFQIGEDYLTTSMDSLETLSGKINGDLIVVKLNEREYDTVYQVISSYVQNIA